MILSEKTKNELGYSLQTATSYDRIFVMCDQCKKIYTKIRRDLTMWEGWCASCIGKKHGKMMGDIYGKAQIKTAYYCRDCGLFLKYSTRVKYCKKCGKRRSSMRMSGRNNPAWKGKTECPICKGKKSWGAKICKVCWTQHNVIRDEKIRILHNTIVKNLYHSNVNFKLAHSIRNRVKNAIHANRASLSLTSMLGCSIDELRIYLESQFQSGMTWENWNTHGWHIDHIRPLNSFDLTNIEQLKKACHYTNLQPLWATDNIRKSNHFIAAN